MGSKGKITIPDSGDDDNVPASILAMAATLFTRIVTYFATEAERTTETAVPSKMSTAEKLGTPAYVDARKGLSFWDGTAWQWVPACKPDVAYRASNANVANTTPLSILSNNMVLPAGNRNVEVSSSCSVRASGTGGWQARTYIVGTNLANGIVGDRTMSFAGDIDTMTRSWWLVCSGTVTYEVWGINANGTGTCEFSDTYLNIIDHGPA